MFLFIVLSSCTEFYVMAPLTIFNSDQTFKDYNGLKTMLNKLKESKVDGIMVDVWWGLVEASPKTYTWTGYDQLFQMFIELGFKIMPVMSFHRCGGNVGDDANIPLPKFIVNSDKKPFFKDQNGNVDDEYISFGYDEVKIEGRTPIQMYKDFIEAFAKQYKKYLDNGTIPEIEVGMGPCGELRYPSYQSSFGWSYPGCGGFQSYDDKMVEKLNNDAAKVNNGFGHNPTNVGDLNALPGESDFWAYDWKSDYGQWYIHWYANQLIEHGKRIMKASREVLPTTKLSSKISGIHWWYMSACHCAEITAGLLNFNYEDGYKNIIESFKSYNYGCCFTCLEMTPTISTGSNPVYLVQQILDDCSISGVEFEGENALETYDVAAYNRIVEWAQKGLSTFTFLRLTDNLIKDDTFKNFKVFVENMHNVK